MEKVIEDHQLNILNNELQQLSMGPLNQQLS